MSKNNKMADFEKKSYFFSTKGAVKWKVSGEQNSF